MLTAPQNVAHPAFEPILRLCQTVLLTGHEVAKHLRYRPEHVHNLRLRRKGPPWLKLGEGAIRYRLSELLRFEIAGHRGPWSLERVSLALGTMPGITTEQRQKIEAHLLAVLEPDAAND
jgi:hypothetical protein